ncbi:MAG: ParB/RepB/Spo0J family partition protein [Roseitalea sp.]|jgi:ParB family chromosome partitioning protein|nr:ParB/RepB/Spo0J family partition protein [Roseitalea sp.]MBO6721154.1 ParB/RepB/Spo0J family partition protein [Roseitalea sp.]MBO6744212.1 ParB/RepB/Spo0J family partition protein [Roseitalea sp.]
MDLQHIPIDQLKLAAVNVRHGRKPPAIDDILPSIRERGILQPLLVRPNGDGFEIVAGRRRYHAAQKIAEEGTDDSPVLPCAIMQTGDDAAALEASLLENVARADMDPMAEYEAFARLVKEGRTVTDIAAIFAVTEQQVKRSFALANLLPAIRRLFKDDRIDVITLRHLTLATKAQQKEWLALWKDADAHVPIGHQLKRWLLGGEQIACAQALFDRSLYTGPIVTDLFGEEEYFGDPDQFWTLQMQSVTEKAEALKASGWADVIVLERGSYFAEWDHEKTPKKKGGKVFATIGHRGDITFHEGWLTRKEARSRERAAQGGDGTVAVDAPAKPEITKAMQRYCELHRHTLVRADLLGHPGIALRLTVAHMIAGSALWTLRPDDQRAPKPEIEASVMAGPAQVAFDAERKAVLALLGMDEDRAKLVRHNGDDYPAAVAFASLLDLTDADVLRVLTFAMVETLQSGSCLVEALGVLLGTNAKDRWQADDVFLDLIKDKTTINAVLADVAGKTVAEANAGETGKTQKRIIADVLRGENGRAKVDDWTPNWLAFPFSGHTDVPVETTSIGRDWSRVASLFTSKA